MDLKKLQKKFKITASELETEMAGQAEDVLSNINCLLSFISVLLIVIGLKEIYQKMNAISLPTHILMLD